MAGNLKVRLNSAGVLALLKSGGVAADIHRRGAAIHAGLPTAGKEEWFLNNSIGFDRAQSIVGTGNSDAKRTAADTNALQRALDLGR